MNRQIGIPSMEYPPEKRNNWPQVLGIVVVLAGFAYLSFNNYVLFHSLAELVTIVVSFMIAMIVLNTYHLFEDSFYLFIGISYGFAGIFDLIHTFAYQGMGVFPNATTNLAPQMWLIARYIDSLALLAAMLFFGRKVRPKFLFIFYTILSTLLLLSVFYWQVFPVCFIDGVGLTPFKVISEYVICGILLSSIILIKQYKDRFHARVYHLFILVYLTMIATELSFTFYVNMYGYANMVGHLFKLISYYFLYKAIIQTSLKEPYNLLFYKLKQVNGELNYKTEQLSTINETLKQEILERENTEIKLKHISFHDSLTGLYNRGYFEEEMRRLASSRFAPICIVIADIDGLKLVNDNLGHQVGDKVIKLAAGLLQDNFRESDVVARVGGDEFAVILPQTDLNVAKQLMERVELAVNRISDCVDVPLFISMGCAVSASAPPNMEELFHEADNNMYANKEQRRQYVRGRMHNTSTYKKLQRNDLPQSRMPVLS